MYFITFCLFKQTTHWAYFMQTGVLDVIGGDRLLSFDLHINVHSNSPGHSWLVCTLVCEEHKIHSSTVTELKTSKSEWADSCDANTVYVCISSIVWFNWPRLYQTSISPLRVRTSMIVWPRKSSDSRLNFCFTRDLMSSSSSHTRTLMRSEELWHSLKHTHSQQQLNIAVTLRGGQEDQMNYYHDSLKIKRVGKKHLQ